MSLIVASLLLGTAVAAPRPATEPVGLLVVAHGANPGWNARVRETVAQVRWSGPVATAFLMGPEAAQSSFAAGVRALVNGGAGSIVIVPLMVSSHGAHYRQIRFYAGELDELPAELREHDHGGAPERLVPMRVTAALDDAPELGAAVRDGWAALDARSRERPLYLVAHGPGSDDEAARWIANVERALAGAGQFAPTRGLGLLRDDAAPPVRAAAVSAMRSDLLRMAEAAGDSVTVLPLLISTGQITTATIPRDLAGLPIRYHAWALAPSPHLARWIERIAAPPGALAAGTTVRP